MPDRSLPSAFYTDSKQYKNQLEKYFLPSWQFAVPAESLSLAGTQLPYWFAEGSLHEPLLLTVDEAGEKRVLANVCTHRAKLLVEKPQHGQDIRCGYHGRCFALDGSMKSMPGMGDVLGFPAASDDLRRFNYAELLGLGFVGLETNQSCRDWLQPVIERTAYLPWHRLKHRPEYKQDYPLNAHWALYVDNYLEGFHIPFVHPALTQQLALREYEYENFQGGSLQLGLGNNISSCFEPPAGHPDAGKRIAAYYFWLFPNLMINLYPWGLSLNQVLPQGVDKTIVRYNTFVWDESQWGTGAGADTHGVELEDRAVVEAVQKGMQSRYWQPGLYAPRHEAGVQWFHAMMR